MASSYFLLIINLSGEWCWLLTHTLVILNLQCKGPGELMWPFSFYHQFLICGFTRSLLLSDAGSVLATATNWDELEIQEETESGSSVTSKIRLPTQVSSSHCHRYLGCKTEQTALGKQNGFAKSFPYVLSEVQLSGLQVDA